MKYTLLFLLLPVFSQAQKIVEDKKDEFTGAIVKRTNWIQVAGGAFEATFYIRAGRVDSTNYLYLRIIYGSRIVYSIPEGAKLMLKMQDASVITLENTEYQLSTRGGGAIDLIGSDAPGTKTTYPVSDEDVAKLINTPIIKLRCYLSDSYFEDEIKDKKAKQIQQLFSLL